MLVCSVQLAGGKDVQSFFNNFFLFNLKMAGEFFAGIGQAFVGGLATIGTLGLVKEVRDWTEEGADKIYDNAEKAWGKDGEVTKFAESLPGNCSIFLV